MGSKPRKRLDGGYRTEVEVFGAAASDLDKLTQLGLYGRDKEEVVQEIFIRGLEAQVGKFGKILDIDVEPNMYGVRLGLSGYTAHAVDKLIGVKGKNREEVIKYILTHWLGSHWEELNAMGISVRVKDGKLEL